ncbi:hypothetical protein HAHE_31930 [Haloferula helveola]|uniref:Autotransporter domain-containing protein n=1 Tax=Haloferula helveola TaxID=490095 RepID=A0ABM7RGI6_9BACT|nr:hypothetical protein HAHE_31930 [Haloferula helveola]
MKAFPPLGTGVFLLLTTSFSGAVTWDNSSLDGSWSEPTNWDGDVEPSSADDVVFPLGLGGTITTNSTENALSLSFDDDYLLDGGTVALASGNSITVAAGKTATISCSLNITDGLTKLGDGRLVLEVNNTNAVGNTISAGTLVVASNNALGGSGSVTTVNSGTVLEIADGIASSRNLTLMDGATIFGVGAATNNGKATIDAGATAVTLQTGLATDVFTMGNGTNDLTGGSSATVIDIAGPGTVRLGGGSDFPGSWVLPGGVLELASSTALGNQTSESVTLSGGTLSARLNTSTDFGAGSPAAQLIMTADSGLRSDRSGNGSGSTHTFGTLSMGTNTLTVDPGENVISGTASIVLGDVTLSGDPTFAVNDSLVAGARLEIGTLIGGGVARAVVKTGDGDLTLNGGTTDLPAGSSFVATGGGVIELDFGSLGAAGTVAITDAQNPLGAASVSITDGGLTLLANGSGTNAVQTYQLGNSFVLGGTFTLDANRLSGSNTNKTFELPGATLLAGTELTMVGDQLHGVALSGPLALSGDATLKGVDITSRDGLLTLDGGITGSVGDALTIEGGTSPLNLTINASGTYGGGTTVTGSNVILNAVDALGTGPLLMEGGDVFVNVAGALNGTVTVNGGTLEVSGYDLLASNALVIGGGTVEIRNNTGDTVPTTSLSVSGTSSLLVGNNGSGFGQTMIFPLLSVSGDTTLSLLNSNGFTPEIQALDLAGNLTLDHNITARIGGITEDLSPRTLLKTGNGTLELNGAGTHSGGTEVLAGVLLVNDGSALGSGDLTIGDVSGTSNAIARFAAGLNIPNDIVARSGSTGTLTLDATSGNVTWTGNVDLQQTLNLDNGSGSQSSTLSGVISGAGNLVKVSAGEVILGSAANTFGSGAADSVMISDGVLTVASDGALGNPANGVTLDGIDGVLRVDGTFGTSRTITATGTSTGVGVTAGNEFTVNVPLAGAGTLEKVDDGTMTIAAGVDSSGRGAADTEVAGGILRIQGPKALSDSGPLLMNSNSGTLELLVDASTDFGHPLTMNGNGPVIHVDRAIGGSGSNGRHRLGDATTTVGDLTVTGDNGYGLSLGAFTATSNSSLTNEAPAALQVDSILGDPGNFTRTFTVSGSGDTEVLGAISQGPGTGVFRLTKTGEGTFRFGTSVGGFGDIVTVRDGTLDLNGLTFLAESLVLGGGASVAGAQIDTAGGTLQLGSGLTYSSSSPPPEGAVITGTVDLGSALHTFQVNNSTGADQDVTIDGPIVGTAGAEIVKAGSGTFRMTGAGNSYPGPTSITSGVVELGKSAGDAVPSGGLVIEGAEVLLTAGSQINDSASVTMDGGGDTVLDLAGFSETTGSLSLTQTGTFNYTAIRTGAAGTLVLNGDVSLNNNTSSTFSDGREVVITGSGDKSTPTTDGTLDLGGAVRTIEVSTTTVGTYEPNANATIETQIINGGIIKTGSRTLFLDHPNNTFAGGLVIAEGSVRPATAGSLGTGPVSFDSASALDSGIDLTAFTGTYAESFSITGGGSGSTIITYAGPAPSTLELSGGFTLERDVGFDVVNGNIDAAICAVLDVTGTIDDGAFTAGVAKYGDGLLDLSAGNTYSGGTSVFGGTLRVPDGTALGDGTAAITIDGGCLHTLGSVAAPGDLVFGASGGSLRVDASATVDVPGNVAWDAGQVGLFGAGTTVLSGTSSGAGGDLLLGGPTAFAPGFFNDATANGHILSLRGTATLPAGNLNIVNDAVLELGSGDLTRPLGTSPGEVQMETAVGGGFAAYGADRVVNLGGLSATVVMGQTPFLYKNVSGNDYGKLIFGSPNATHQLEFQNPIELDNGLTFVSRKMEIRDGGGAIDALLSGGLSQSADPNTTYTSLGLYGDGVMEISGPMSGEIEIFVEDPVTLRLTGSNTMAGGDYYVNHGTIFIGGDASFGDPDDIFIETPGTFDASALTGPVGLDPSAYFQMDGTWLGSISTPSYFEGHGSISGDLHLLAGSEFFPNTGGTLSVGGDFTLDATAVIDLFANGLVPETNFNRMEVAGAVNLSGDLDISVSNLSLGDSVVMLLNDGVDPINGTFTGFPEGSAIALGSGLAIELTYQANGDGGAVGNDFGFTVVVDTFSADLNLIADSPLSIAPGEEIVIDYTIENTGGTAVGDGALEISLPANATFVSSTPAGTLAGSLLTITLPALAAPDSTTVELRLTAPGTPEVVEVWSSVSTAEFESDYTDNGYFNSIAVLPGGAPALDTFGLNGLGDQFDLSFQTVSGVVYAIQSSNDLVVWTEEVIIEGDGNPYAGSFTVDQDREFFRVVIVSQNGSNGGGE